MKETGLMFKAPLVRAILDDQKTQTRRLISPQPIALAVGDKLHFVINCGQHNYYDATKWYPTVEYTSREYVRDEFDPVYYQKSGNDLKELEFSETADGYLADDNVAFISDSAA